MAKVLAGFRVVEQGTYITGPVCAMHLADLGAEVVKVELPGSGDPFRAFGGSLYSANFQSFNRNKKSITLDTRKPEDLKQFDRLVSEADVYIQNFRPGFAQQIGAGPERLTRLNPRLVYCAISGFGTTGPYADRPAFDTVAQAATGFLSLMVNPADPRVTGPAVADTVTGMYAAQGILGALLERSRTGKGRTVDVSMFEAMTHFNLDAFQHYFSTGARFDAFTRAAGSQAYVLQCHDGRWIALHMSSPERFWQGLAKAIERPGIFEDPRFRLRQDRMDHHEELIGYLRPLFAARSSDEWCKRLSDNDVPYARAHSVAEAVEDPQAIHLELFTSVAGVDDTPFRAVRSPISYDGEKSLDLARPPQLGEHNEQFANGWPSAEK